MPPREPKRKRLTPLTIGLGAGAIGCFALAIGLWASSAISHQRAAELSPIGDLIEDADLVTEDHDGLPLMDDEAMPDPWAGAEEAYPGLAAWLELDAAGISTPVMQASGDAPDWFLDHDAYGNESAGGLPYLDHRCSPDDVLRVVYAHNLGWGSNEGFGSLADAWQQEVFEGLGEVRWANLGGEATNPDDGSAEEGGSGEFAGDGDGETAVDTFRPVCALKIDGDQSDLFNFELDRHGATEWLDGILARADAVTSDGRAGGAMSDHFLALVTCAGDGYPSQSRTVVVFGDGDEVYFDSYGALLEGIEAMTQGFEEYQADDRT